MGGREVRMEADFNGRHFSGQFWGERVRDRDREKERKREKGVTGV